MYFKSFYKKYLQNLKYNVKRGRIFHLILFVKNRGVEGYLMDKSMTKIIFRQSLKLFHVCIYFNCELNSTSLYLSRANQEVTEL